MLFLKIFTKKLIVKLFFLNFFSLFEILQLLIAYKYVIYSIGNFFYIYIFLFRSKFWLSKNETAENSIYIKIGLDGIDFVSFK